MHGLREVGVEGSSSLGNDEHDARQACPSGLSAQARSAQLRHRPGARDQQLKADFAIPQPM